MLLRPCSIHQCGTELLWRVNPQLYAQPVVELDAGFCRSLAQYPMNARQLDKHIHDSRRIFCRDQDVQIAHCIAHPSQAPTGLRVHDPLHLLKLFDQGLRDGVGTPQRDTDRPA